MLKGEYLRSKVSRLDLKNVGIMETMAITCLQVMEAKEDGNVVVYRFMTGIKFPVNFKMEDTFIKN